MSQADSVIVVNPQNWDKYTKAVLKSFDEQMDIDQDGCIKINEFLHLVTHSLLLSIYKTKTPINENCKVFASSQDLLDAINRFIRNELAKCGFSQVIRTQRIFQNAKISKSKRDHEFIMNKSDEITKQSGLTFDVGTVFNVLNENSFKLQFEFLFYIGFSSVLEYLSAELLELAVEHATKANKKIINAELVEMAIENDDELKDLFQRIKN
ncbi:histone h2a [Anaeramoeba flamelloides]|uniref:Histone h2a n=1 Tax=Anaeramoeba flamelloides TaxID=1746091 RepID=A0AAV8A7V8_9EUKA|nr:histone h2a [Anaeramoeba flamelloides]